MRKKNSKPEFADQRSKALLQNFRASIAAQSVISLKKALHEAIESPAPRFWVSESRATLVISFLLKGIDVTEGMFPEKRKMYLEIFRRVEEMRRRDPATPLGDIVFEVVNSRAPSSYLSLKSAERVIKYAKSRVASGRCRLMSDANQG